MTDYSLIERLATIETRLQDVLEEMKETERKYEELKEAVDKTQGVINHAMLLGEWFLGVVIALGTVASWILSHWAEIKAALRR